MDLLEFTDKINLHTARIRDLKAHATSEESTKNALINPFLQILGYDTSDPRVVQFEFTADVGSKKGEKVDYAITRDKEIIMLIEAKKVGASLDANKASQLHRYFHNTSARIAILTDGIIYEFYTDLDKDNIMDKKPFMIFNFEDVNDRLIPEIRKLANDTFSLDIALAAAQELKYARQLKQILKKEFQQPSNELVKLLLSQFIDKPLRTTLIEEFRPKVKSVIAQYLNEELINLIQGATKQEDVAIESQEEVVDKSEIITTQEEIEAFMIVKSILRKDIPLSKVIMRDTQSYCGILFDNNNRKPICRFHFNSDRVKYFSTFDGKTETKHKIECIDDIFNFSEEIVNTALQYLNS